MFLVGCLHNAPPHQGSLHPHSSGVVAGGSTEEERLSDYVQRHRHEMVRLTQEPYHVSWAGAELCGRPYVIARSPHGEHWIHIHISPKGANVMRTGIGTYPEGTVILKQKFLDAAATKTEFFTGMRKREPGYNPAFGDWEFFVMEARGWLVTARGRIESCMDCHSKYKATDFVSRRCVTPLRTRSDESMDNFARSSPSSPD